MKDDQIFERLHADAEAIREYGVLFGKMSGRVDVLVEKIEQTAKQMENVIEMTIKVHKLATSVELHAQKVEFLAEKMDARISTLEDKQEVHAVRIDALEKAPAEKIKNRWEQVLMQVILICVAAGFGALLLWIGS